MQHPAAPAHGDDRLRSQHLPYADEQRIAAAFVKLAEPGPPGDLLSTEHTSRVLDEKAEDRPFLRSQSASHAAVGGRSAGPGSAGTDVITRPTVSLARFTVVGAM